MRAWLTTCLAVSYLFVASSRADDAAPDSRTEGPLAPATESPDVPEVDPSDADARPTPERDMPLVPPRGVDRSGAAEAPASTVPESPVMEAPVRSVLVPRSEPPAVSPPVQSTVRLSSPATDVVAAVLPQPEVPREGGDGNRNPRGREPGLQAALDSLGPTRSLPLVEALERSGDRSRRGWVVSAYWKASAAVMRLAWAAEVVAHVDTIAPGADLLDRATLDVAAAEAMADLSAAKAAVVEACQELADIGRLPIGDPLPLPADRPLAAPYQTHFDAIFAQRLATGRVRAVNRSLPHLHDALESRAGGILAASTALAAAEREHARGDRPIESVAVALEGLGRHRERFLATLLGYNGAIAEYAGAVADLGVDEVRFATMLIGNPLPSTWRQVSVVGFEQATIPPPGQTLLPAGAAVTGEPAVPLQASGRSPP